MRILSQAIKSSIYENQLLRLTGVSCDRGGFLKFEVRVGTDPHVPGENAVLIPNT